MNIVKYKDLKAGDHLIDITSLPGMSGFFAVNIWMNGEDVPGSVFLKPWQTGIEKYECLDDAVIGAETWALDENIPVSPRLAGHIEYLSWRAK